MGIPTLAAVEFYQVVDRFTPAKYYEIVISGIHNFIVTLQQVKQVSSIHCVMRCRSGIFYYCFNFILELSSKTCFSSLLVALPYQVVDEIWRASLPSKVRVR